MQFPTLLLAQSSIAYVHLLPMVILVSLIWGATRHEHWPDIMGHTVRFSAMVLVFMAGVYAFLKIAPLFPWYVWVGLLIAAMVLMRYSPAPRKATAKTASNS